MKVQRNVVGLCLGVQSLRCKKKEAFVRAVKDRECVSSRGIDLNVFVGGGIPDSGEPKFRGRRFSSEVTYHRRHKRYWAEQHSCSGQEAKPQAPHLNRFSRWLR